MFVDYSQRLKENKRDQIHHKAKKYNKPEDWQLYKKLRNRVNNKLKQILPSYYFNRMEENEFKQSKFWDKRTVPDKGAKTLTTSLSNNKPQIERI